MPKLRAAVVGAGSMGRNHVRILAGQPDVDLVAVCDQDAALLAQRVSGTSAAAVTSVEELPDLDLAVIATPTPSHVPIATTLIDKGVSVLVEKPLALTTEDAEALTARAEQAGVVLAVGHVERFNAAYGLLQRLAGKPILLTFERMSPFTPRISDSVVMDLMVHDLDLALWITGEYPDRIEAVGSTVFSDSLDAVTAILRFPSGAVASFTTSRITQDKVRRITISEAERFIVADSIRQDVLIKRETEASYGEDGGSVAYRQANVVEVPYLDRSGEPLMREARDFIEAVKSDGTPTVTGADGLAVVRLAREIERLASS